MIPLNVFKVGHSTMTVVVGRGVRRAKTITLRPMAVIAIPILMELKQIPFPVPLLIKAYMIPLNVFKVGHSTMTVVAGRSVRRAKTITLRPMAVIAIPILMELKQIPLPVSLLTRFKNPSGLFAAHK